MKALQQFLRPEFINRVDEIVYFNKLTEENFLPIARLMLDELKGSLKEKGLTFTYDDALVSYLVKKSYLRHLWRPEPPPHHPERGGGCAGLCHYRQL